METLEQNIRRQVRSCLNAMKSHINQLAEQHAEVYVSSTLGLEEGEEKENTKKQYIEEFVIELRKLI